MTSLGQFYILSHYSPDGMSIRFHFKFLQIKSHLRVAWLTVCFCVNEQVHIFKLVQCICHFTPLEFSHHSQRDSLPTWLKNLLLAPTQENFQKFAVFSVETSSPHQDTETGCTGNSIPSKTLKLSVDISADVL